MSNWSGIDEFVAIATAGSFTGGAEAFGASTTHMSRAILKLEARIQTQLFHRTTRKVRLTDSGRVFLEHCESIIRARDEAIALINERGEPEGELRITCSTAMGERFVAPIVRRYCEKYSKLKILLNFTNQIVDLVGEGFDFAIRTGQLSDSRLIGTRIASRTFYTCASVAYLRAEGQPQSIEDLKAHQCLTGTRTTWHFDVNDNERIFRPQGRWRCNSGAAVVDAALAGLGICQLPEFYVIPFIASGQLRPILDEFRPAPEPIWAVYPQRRHLLPKISKLVEILRDELPSALEAKFTQ